MLKDRMSAVAYKWFTFVVLVLGGGTIFKLSSLKDAFYVPMQEFMGLSNTQIGMALSVYGLVQTIGNFASIYLADRFSKRKMISISLVGIGLTGIYISTFPGYMGILISWALLSFWGEIVYWPVLLKAVRLLGTSEEQGRLFGFLEAGRGIVDTIVAFTALAIFVGLGETAFALRGSILFYSGIVIAVGIVSYFLVEDDKVSQEVLEGKVSQSKVAFDGMLKAIKMPGIWVVSFMIFSVYSVYCGLTYFIPFLKDIYGLPVALVGAYGIINQYGLKMVGGPVGGFLVDKKFHSPIRYTRVALIIAIIYMVIFMMLPHKNFNVYLGMVLTLGYGAIIFTMRAVFFANVDEIDVPRDISGAAMSIACILGYAPQLFCFALYGYLLDSYPGFTGYQFVFSCMIGFSILGVIISTVLLRMVKRRKAMVQ